MKATRSQTHTAKSPRWRGNPRQYQIEAQARLAVARDMHIFPWSWVTTDCEVEQCLVTDCMTLHRAKRLEYPRDICVYCGEPGYTRDHLIPEPMSGAALRNMVLTVPSCKSCNAIINDLPIFNVNERRRHAQLSIERRNKRLLAISPLTEDEEAQLGHALLSASRRMAIKRDRVKARLSWPHSPHYDLRAFQRSGIEDPVSAGLCEPESKPLRPEYAIEELGRA